MSDAESPLSVASSFALAKTAAALDGTRGLATFKCKPWHGSQHKTKMEQRATARHCIFVCLGKSHTAPCRGAPSSAALCSVWVGGGCLRLFINDGCSDAHSYSIIHDVTYAYTGNNSHKRAHTGRAHSSADQPVAVLRDQERLKLGPRYLVGALAKGCIQVEVKVVGLKHCGRDGFLGHKAGLILRVAAQS